LLANNHGLRTVWHLTNGGGPGVLATDALIECGGKQSRVVRQNFEN
jgi:acyl-CoA synthetase (NDP forming)